MKTGFKSNDYNSVSLYAAFPHWTVPKSDDDKDNDNDDINNNLSKCNVTSEKKTHGCEIDQ